MYARLLCLLSVLVVSGPASGVAQSLDADGTVTEVSSDRIVVEFDTTAGVASGDRGRIFVSRQMGNGGRQTIISGMLRVETVAGPLVIGRVTEQSNLLDIQTGQHVAFETGSSGGGVGGVLRVRSTPSRAAVQVTPTGGSRSGGRDLGATPARDSLSAGRYEVRVEKSGFQSARRTVRIRPGADRTLDVSLNRSTGHLVVQPTPDTASVVIDGETYDGPVRDTLEAGRHAIRVAASGFTDLRDTVDVAPGETTTVAPTLKRATGTLTVRSTPGDAQVWVDDSDPRRTPLSVDVKTGRHTIEVSKGGYEVVQDTIQVIGGQTKTVDVELQRPIDIQLAGPNGAIKQARMTRVGDRLQIQYALAGKEKAYDVTVEFSHDGGKTYQEIDHDRLSGDVGDDISPGSDKVVQWNVLEDFPRGIHGDMYRLRLTAEPPVSGEFAIEVQTPPGNFGFGGGRIGWSMTGGFIGASYTQLGNGVTVISARAMPHWTVGGFMTYRTILGLAYIEGVPSALSGGMELGTGVHFGKSFYVGGDVLYLQTLAGQGEVGLVLSVGVAL